MSTATMNGADAVKSAPPPTSPSAAAITSPKQQSKSTNNARALEGARMQASGLADGPNRKQQPAKAWQGPNPITQRASTNGSNGTEKPLPKIPSQPPQTKSLSGAQVDKQAHDRALFLMAQFIGKDATINLRNGEQFTGIFSGGSFDNQKTQYIFKMAKRTKLPTQQQMNGTAELTNEYSGEGEDYTTAFDIQDTISLSVQDVVLSSASKLPNGSAGSSFLTDTQISGRDQHLLRERQLQRWEPGPDSSIGMALGDSGETGWDQFAANERLYGVQSTYDETIYTTAIDKSNPHFRQRAAEADRIAREIEGSAPANMHVAEERRRDAAREEGLDEEDKYSGVKRETVPLPKRAIGAYVPPSQRPISGASSVPGVPFDPAIISTKISQPVQSTAAAANAEHISKSSSAQQAQATSAAAEPSQDTPAGAGTIQPVKKIKENTTEDHVRGTADAFKLFANNEKLRIRQAQEAKRTTARQEKNVKLNDLKKFAANFKLKSRVPDDLVPILAKDREKQLEIQKKADEAAKEEELRVKERDSEKNSNATSPAPTSTTSHSATPSAAHLGADSRMPSVQHRAQTSQSRIRQQPVPALQGHSPRAPLNHRMNPNAYGRGPPQPLPPNLGIPPPNLAPDAPMSPSSATRLNVNAKAFEFRPGVPSFQPQSTPQSPHRESPPTFFDKDEVVESKALSSAYNTLSRLRESDGGDENLKKLFVANGGFPQAYRTQPTWPNPKENDAVKYIDSFPKAPVPNQRPSPMPPSSSSSGMPHNPQMPAHMSSQPIPPTSQRPPYYPPPPPGHAASFDPRFPHFGGPNGSVQNSPRAQSLGPVFNSQLQGMPMPQYPGQPVQGYGMSPSMQYRQLQPPGAPVMMMPGQSPGQLHMRPGYPQGPQFPSPQMGGHMMTHNPSGGYVGGPMPNQGYSPMPPHAQPHMAHMQHGGPTGYSSSPRPPMMQQQGSHQGFQPQMHMQPGFVPSPGQPHPYHMQQRAMSGGYPQMTPRQQHAIPQHPSPSMAGVSAQGDEGK